MKSCRSNRHLMAFLSMGFIGACSSTSTAAPLCSQAFMVYSQESIQNTLVHVAELKLSLDLSLAEGDRNSNPAMKVLRQEYPLKYQELVQKLSNSYSESEVHKMISSEVIKLQGKNKTEKEIEREVERVVRATQKRNLLAYTLKSSVENENRPSKPWWGNRIFHFLEKSDSLIFQKDGRVVRYLMKEDKYQTLSGYARVKVSKDEKFVFALTDKGLLVFDTDKGEVVKSRVAATASSYFSNVADARIDIDPTNQYVLITARDGGLHIIDWAHDSHQTFTNQNSKLSRWQGDPQFLDSENIAMISEGKVQVFNWKQDSLREGYTGSLVHLYVSADKTRLFVTEELERKTFVRTFEVADILTPLGVHSDSPVHNGVFQLISLEDNGLVLIENAGTVSSFDIYNVADFSKPLFTFESSRQEGTDKSRGFTVSADGKTVINAVEAPGSGKHYLDIWQRVN